MASISGTWARSFIDAHVASRQSFHNLATSSPADGMSRIASTPWPAYKHQLGKSAAIIGSRSTHAVTALRGASDGVRCDDVALAGTVTDRWASCGFPDVERPIAEYAMRRIGPSVLKADGQHGIGGFGPSNRTLVLVVRTGLLRRDEPRADQHAGRSGQQGAADVRAALVVGSPKISKTDKSKHRRGGLLLSDVRVGKTLNPLASCTQNCGAVRAGSGNAHGNCSRYEPHQSIVTEMGSSCSIEKSAPVDCKPPESAADANCVCWRSG
jgi:hypothetical protein